MLYVKEYMRWFMHNKEQPTVDILGIYRKTQTWVTMCK